MNYMNRGEPKHASQPIMADPSRHMWARFARLEMERRQYTSRPTISTDDITNLKIVLGTAQTVQDVINNA